MFKELDKRKTYEVEKDILESWKKGNTFQKSIDNREGCKDYVFYDGPIYANAKPGIHHVFAKTIKDSFTDFIKGYPFILNIINKLNNPKINELENKIKILNDELKEIDNENNSERFQSVLKELIENERKRQEKILEEQMFM